MQIDLFLREVIAKNSVSAAAVAQAANRLLPTIRRWANAYLLDVHPSGSFAKGTAVLTGTDIDLFISLSPDTSETYAEIHQTLSRALEDDGFVPRPQNVSIGVKVGPYDVDLVPGRRPDLRSNDHHIFRRKSSSWTKTNIQKQVYEVANSGRIDEIRLAKIWRNKTGLDFPSCYLELFVIEALRGRSKGLLQENILRAFEAMTEDLQRTRVVDPGNPSNIISNELTHSEKRAVAEAARLALGSSWERVFG